VNLGGLVGRRAGLGGGLWVGGRGSWWCGGCGAPRLGVGTGTGSGRAGWALGRSAGEREREVRAWQRTDRRAVWHRR